MELNLRFSDLTSTQFKHMNFSRIGNKRNSIESQNKGIVLFKFYISPHIRCSHAKNKNLILLTYLKLRLYDTN
jgi:hypothetical protein